MLLSSLSLLNIGTSGKEPISPRSSNSPLESMKKRRKKPNLKI